MHRSSLALASSLSRAPDLTRFSSVRYSIDDAPPFCSQANTWTVHRGLILLCGSIAAYRSRGPNVQRPRREKWGKQKFGMERWELIGISVYGIAIETSDVPATSIENRFYLCLYSQNDRSTVKIDGFHGGNP